MRRLLILFLCSIVGWLYGQSTQSTGQLPDFVRSGKLRNGLSYMIMENKTPENRAELRLVVRSGSLNEDDDQQGLAHFVEHMCFNGTRNFSKTSLVDFLENTGTRFGPDLNAYTSFDETVYILQVRTDSADLLWKGLLILEDWAGYVTFEPEEIDKERGVVLSEWRTRTGGSERISKITFPVIFKGSRYPERFPIGKTDIIQNAPYEAFKRYYRDWYRPDLITVIAVGDFDAALVERHIRKRFSKLKRVKNPRTHASREIPLDAGARVVSASDPEIQNFSLNIRFMAPEIDYFAPDGLEKSFLIGITNDLLNARIREFLTTSQSKLLNASAFVGNSLGNSSALTLSLLPKDRQWYEACQQLFNLVKVAGDHLPSKEELDFVIQAYRRRLESEVRVKDKTPSSQWTSRLVAHAVGRSPFLDPEARLDYFDRWASSLTPEMMSELIKYYLNSSTWAASAISSESEKLYLPNEPQLAAAVYYFQSKKTYPYVFSAPAPRLQVSEAEIKDESTEQIPENAAGYRGFALSNGMQFYIRKVSEDKDRILIDGFLFGGNSPFPDSLLPAANYLMQTVYESGVGTHDITELRKILAGRRINVFPYLSNYYHGINGFSSPEELETAFQLIRLYLTEPRIEEEALSRVKAREVNLLKGLFNNPDAFFGRELNRILYNSNPRAVTPTVSQVEKITLNQQKDIWKQLFSAPAQMRWIFTGDVDEEKVKELAIRYLSDIQNKANTLEVIDRNLRINVSDSLYALKKGENPRSQVRMVFYGRVNDPEQEWQIKAATEVLGIKLREELREEKGGVYGVSVFYNLNSPFNDEYTAVIAFNTEPARKEELIKATRQVVAAHAQKVDQETLQKIKELLRQDVAKGQSQAIYWHGLMQGVVKFSKPDFTADTEAYLNFVNTLTADELSLWIMRYLGMRPVVVVMDPEVVK